MARTVKGRSSKRAYDSSKRQEHARETRRAILEAARALFITTGYAGSTLQAVADEAGVAVQTVYAAFGNKMELLRQVMNVAVVGDDEAVPLIEREAVLRIAAEPDQRKRARLQATLIREIAERTAPVAMVARAAGAASPEAADMWRAFMAERRVGMTHAASTLAGKQGLRVPVDEAADVLHVLWSPEVYTMLVDELGWTGDQYENWITEALERLLLP